MNTFTTLIAFLAIAGFVILMPRLVSQQPQTPFCVGILQTASHPALNAARQGFIDTLKASLQDRIAFVERNAQGSLVDAHTLATHLHADTSLSALCALGSPALQALASTNSTRPLVFAAVTDPQAVGIRADHPSITGVCDMINVKQQVAVLNQLVPQAKTVAILSNAAEINSRTMADAQQEQLKHIGKTVLRYSVTHEGELLPALERALEHADAILCPLDNTIACASALVAQKARTAKKPLIVSDIMLLSDGALAAIGVDYYAQGCAAAQLMLELLLNGKTTAQLPIVRTSKSMVKTNSETAALLSISLEHLTSKGVS